MWGCFFSPQLVVGIMGGGLHNKDGLCVCVSLKYVGRHKYSLNDFIFVRLPQSFSLSCEMDTCGLIFLSLWIDKLTDHIHIYAEAFMYDRLRSFIGPLQKCKQGSFCLTLQHTFPPNMDSSLMYTRCLLKVALYCMCLSAYTLFR